VPEPHVGFLRKLRRASEVTLEAARRKIPLMLLL